MGVGLGRLGSSVSYTEGAGGERCVRWWMLLVHYDMEVQMGIAVDTEVKDI